MNIRALILTGAAAAVLTLSSATPAQATAADAPIQPSRESTRPATEPIMGSKAESRLCVKGSSCPAKTMNEWIVNVADCMESGGILKVPTGSWSGECSAPSRPTDPSDLVIAQPTGEKSGSACAKWSSCGGGSETDFFIAMRDCILDGGKVKAIDFDNMGFECHGPKKKK